MNREFRAIIFDFDGTIVDTETPAYEAWRSVFEDYGCELPVEVWADCIGTADSGFDPFLYLGEQVGRQLDRQAVQAERRHRNRELMVRQEPLPGVREWLQDGTDLGMKFGIASSSPRRWIIPLLSQFELSDWFHAVAAGDEVLKTKPDPQVYRLAAQRLGVKPSQAIAIEDSPNGVMAAVAAGLLCVAVPNTMTAGLDFQQADFVFPSLADISLSKLLQLA